MLTGHFVGNSILAYGDFDQRFLGGLTCFADGFGHFVGLAEAATNLTLPVAGHDQRTEAEATAAFDDLSASVDEDYLLRESGFVLPSPILVAISAIAGCWHDRIWLEK
jgi:hypothetical protein